MKTVPKAEKPRVMVVEDDPVHRKLFKHTLSPEFDVIVLPHGGALLDDVEAFEPDALVMDMGLPGASGPELCRRLKLDPRHAALPVVFVTALPDDDHFLDHMTSGGDALVAKSSSPELLRRTLREVLRAAGGA
jgi:putative two-component system response regulator